MNNAETTQFNCTFLVQSVVAAVGAVGGTVMSIVKRVPPRRLAALCMIPVVLLLAAWCIAWGGNGRSRRKAERGEQRVDGAG